MDTTPDRRIAEMEGGTALPRKNGELVFAAPWEGRVFGMTVALNEQQLYDWEEFRSRLIAAIASNAAAPYYEAWLASFETLLIEKGILTREELDTRTAEFASGKREDVS